MIYFIKAENRLKIGFAEDPSKRIPSIQTSSPFKLEVLLILEGNYEVERTLHSKFQVYRLSGEWFEFSESLKKFINENSQFDRKYEFGFETNEFDSNEQLRRVRNSKNLSLKALGKLLNMTKQSVSENEIREKKETITLNNIKKVGEALGYKLEYRFVQMDFDNNESVDNDG